MSSTIPGLRTMAIVRWVLLAAVAAVAVSTWWLYALDSDTASAGPDRYYCPMHPQIRSAEPGTCPICFMRLEPIPAERAGGAASTSTHAAHAAHAHAPPVVAPGDAPPGTAPVMLTLERRQSVGIALADAVLREVSRELRLPAVIEVPSEAVSEVRVRTAAFIERVAPIEIGQRVRAGQALAWAYAPEIFTAEAELLTARRLHVGASEHTAGDRIEGAARERLDGLGVSAADIDEVLSSGRARRQVPIRTLSAGVVTARDVAVGTQALPDRVLFEVTDFSRVWASATIAVGEAAQIPKGTPGRFVSRSGTSRPVNALLVEPVVSSETRSTRARFAAANADLGLRPGEIGEVVVTLAPQSYLLVPRDAVVDGGQLQYVFVETDPGLFAPRVVTPGPLVGESRAIAGGLEPGARVVARGTFVLDSESRLQAAVAPRETPPAETAP